MRKSFIVVLTGVALATCGGVSNSAPISEPGAVSIQGFDTRDYPGDAAMRTWRDSSPYRWVGFYLPAPCYTGTTWMGTRSRLMEMNWGIAVVFVGEQDWAAMTRDSAGATPSGTRCTVANLTAQKGEEDAAAAIGAASGEGFARGTPLYLDVERVDSVSAKLAEYVRAWTAAVLRDSRYIPGLYAHERNVAPLQSVMSDAFRGAGSPTSPTIWVAHSANFSRASRPAESGVLNASIWQGIFNTTETWGGATLRIDVNVASPSLFR